MDTSQTPRSRAPLLPFAERHLIVNSCRDSDCGVLLPCNKTQSAPLRILSFQALR